MIVAAVRCVGRVAVRFGLLLVLGALCVAAAAPAHADVVPADANGGTLTNISFSNHVLGAPVMKVGADGTVYAAWIEGPLSVSPPDNTPWRIHYQDSHDGGQTWHNQFTVSENPSHLSSTMDAVALAVDGKGRAHVVWSERPASGPRPINIYYRRFDPANTVNPWSDTLRVAQSAGSSDPYSDDPNVAINLAAGADGTIHLVWGGYNTTASGTHWAIWYASSPDGGANWGGLTAVSNETGPEGGSIEPIILPEANGDVHVAWRGGKIGVEARHRIGGVWGKIERIDSYGWYPSLAMDAAGTVYLTYRSVNDAGAAAGDKCCYSIKFTAWTRASSATKTPWTPPQLIGATPTETGQFLDGPDITATDDGKLFLYYMGDNGTGTSGHEILFVTSPNGGRSWSDPIEINGGRDLWPKAGFWHDATTGRDGQYLVFQHIFDDSPGGHNVALYKWSPPGLASLPDMQTTISPSVPNSSSPYAVQAGQTLTFTITLTNTGKADGQKVALDAALNLSKPGLTGTPTLPQITSGDPTGWTFAVPTFNDKTPTVIAQGGTIPKGGSVTISFSTTAAATLPATATLSSVFHIAAFDSFGFKVLRRVVGPTITYTNTPPTGQFSKQVQVLTKGLYVAENLGPGALLLPGDIINVTLTAHDNGTTPLTNLSLSDALPPGVQLMPTMFHFSLTTIPSVPIKGKQGFALGDTPAPLVSGGYLLPGQTVNAEYQALVTAAVTPGVTDATVQGYAAEVGATSGDPFNYTFGDPSAFARPALGADARMGVQLTTSPDIRIGIKPQTAAPGVTLTAKLHNFEAVAQTNIKITFILGGVMQFDTLQTKKGQSGHLTGGTYISVATSAVVVAVPDIAAGDDAVVTLQLALTNDRSVLLMPTAVHLSVLYNDGQARQVGSNSVALIFHDHDLSSGLTDMPRPLSLSAGSPIVHIGKRPISSIAGGAFEAKEPLAVYAVGPNGATPVLLFSMVASTSGGVNVRVDLSQFNTPGLYRIVVVGGWSGTLGVGQITLAA